jgi:hypothetical protein
MTRSRARRGKRLNKTSFLASSFLPDHDELKLLIHACTRAHFFSLMHVVGSQSTSAMTVIYLSLYIYIVRVLCRLLALVQHAHPHVLRIVEGEMRLIKLALVVGTHPS